MVLTDYVLFRGGTAKLGCPVLADLAALSECSPATLYMIALGHKKASHKLATRIANATSGVVTRRILRPDIFGPAGEGGRAS